MENREGIKGILLISASDSCAQLLAEKIKKGLEAFIADEGINVEILIHNNQKPIEDLLGMYYSKGDVQAAATRKTVDEMLSKTTPSPFLTYSDKEYHKTKPKRCIIACEVRNKETVDFYKNKGFVVYFLHADEELRCSNLVKTFPLVDPKNAHEFFIDGDVTLEYLDSKTVLDIKKPLDVALHASIIVSDQIKSL